MINLRRYAFGVAFAVLGPWLANAAPPLTVVQDILFNADGTKFNGVATISWTAFEASDMSNISAHSISTQVVNGVLRVALVPTTNALSPASYSVVYNTDGNIQFTEVWAVPPSNVPVPVALVRVGGTGTIVGGGGGGTPPPVLNSINIADVVGLTSALNLRPTAGVGYGPSRAAVIDATGSLNAAIGNASDCIHVDGTSAPCGSSSGSPATSTTFVDGEVPAGTMDGTNAIFTLGNTPSPPSSVMLYRNGILLKQNLDYMVSGLTITFNAVVVPKPTDLLIASYRYGLAPTSFSFVDGETPAGVIDGSNTVFTVAQAPNPVASLAVYRNGMRLRANLDYTVSTNTILFAPGLAPKPGDVLQCSYRH
jgi:hypothetical protein